MSKGRIKITARQNSTSGFFMDW